MPYEAKCTICTQGVAFVVTIFLNSLTALQKNCQIEMAAVPQKQMQDTSSTTKLECITCIP